VAHILRDAPILVEARKEAFRLVEEDPALMRPAHSALKNVLVRRWKGRLELATIG
jgi:ATP-dependent DNA helicase RecG